MSPPSFRSIGFETAEETHVFLNQILSADPFCKSFLRKNLWWWESRMEWLTLNQWRTTQAQLCWDPTSSKGLQGVQGNGAMLVQLGTGKSYMIWNLSALKFFFTCGVACGTAHSVTCGVTCGVTHAWHVTCHLTWKFVIPCPPLVKSSCAGHPLIA
jgi:hypothetical protein